MFWNGAACFKSQTSSCDCNSYKRQDNNKPSDSNYVMLAYVAVSTVTEVCFYCYLKVPYCIRNLVPLDVCTHFSSIHSVKCNLVHSSQLTLNLQCAEQCWMVTGGNPTRKKPCYGYSQMYSFGTSGGRNFWQHFHNVSKVK